MIFAIGCRGGGGQPPVTKPTQGDQPHAAQPEAPVATPLENTAHGRKDAQSEGLNEAHKTAWSAIMKVDRVQIHPGLQQSSQEGGQAIQRALAEVPKRTAETEPESYIVDIGNLSASDEGSSESPEESHRREEGNNQQIDELAITGTPQSSEHQATAAGN